MTERITVKPDLAHGAGHAIVRIEGIPAGTDPQFRLRRLDFEASFLGPRGWQVADALLKADAAESEGSALILRVGPAVCNAVEEGSVEFSLPAANLVETVVWPAITPEHAGVRRRVAAPPPQAAAPSGDQPREPSLTPVTGPRKLEKIVDIENPIRSGPPPGPPSGPPPGPPLGRRPESRPGPSKVRRSRWWLLLPVVGCLVLALTVGYLKLRPGQALAPVPHPAAAQADLSAMTVPAIVARNNPSEMLAEAQRRLTAGRRDDALQLMLEAADRHYPPALVAVAKYYDPLQPHAPDTVPNARQAARYYKEAAVAGDATSQAEREALKQDLQRRAEGNPMSDEALILKDFWP